MMHYLDEVEDTDETIIIPGSGDREGVVLMSLSEYRSLMETLYLKSSPANHQRLLKSIAEVERGEVRNITLKEIDRIADEQLADGD
jgi:antitoxin YefM